MVVVFPAQAQAQQPAQPDGLGPHTALFYGAQAPVDELAAFDQVVLEPGHRHDIAQWRQSHPGVAWMAYISVGEVRDFHPYLTQLPAAWRVGRNPEWRSELIDMAQPGWPEWFVEQVARPLWNEGYQGFFLDTLDSYRLRPLDSAGIAAQQAGLVRMIRLLRAAFPQARLVLNRGFELLPQVASQIDMVAAESLLRRWNQRAGQYQDVPESDSAWLLERFAEVRTRYRLPVLAIDYAAAHERPLARQLAARMVALGIQPHISNAEFDLVGLGALEVLPRRILVLHDQLLQDGADLSSLVAHRHLDMPLQHLGFIPEHVFVDGVDALPKHSLAGRYAGIVTLFSRNPSRPALAAFLKRAQLEGLRLASFGEWGIGQGGDLRNTLGVTYRPAVARAPLTRTLARSSGADAIGFEVQPTVTAGVFRAYTAPAGSDVLLQWRDDAGALMDAAAYTPWGGYLLTGIGLARSPNRANEWRWAIDPFVFLQRALALPDMPVPDATTESGRRLWLAHIDGDGFANISDQPGQPLAGEVLLRDVLKRYRWPITMSIIEGEVSRQGVNAGIAERLESTARQMLALPHVDAASHTFSHPFNWRLANTGTTGYTLPIPGYQFSIEREVAGSIDYVQTQLAPAGKKVRLFHWSGDTNPSETALAAVAKAGIGAINGGNTIISRMDNSLTRVAPLGLRRGRYFQVFAPNENENPYTGLFTSPLFGYRRVIEAYELTERPRRLKPINVYFHTYSASRRPALEAVQSVLQWTQQQPTHPIHAADFVAKVHDFQHIVVARTDSGFRVRGTRHLRQLRAPVGLGLPQMRSSSGLAGYSAANVDERYLHLSADEAWLRFAPHDDGAPRLVDANARVTGWQSEAAHAQLELAGHLPLRFALAHDDGCQVLENGVRVTPATATPPFFHYALERHGPATFTIACR